MGLLVVVAALASALPAAASFMPVRRTFGDLTIPRVRAGSVRIPAAHRSGRVRVIVGLPKPPLAAAYGRSFAATGTTRKLNVATAASRAYLRRVVAAQRVAATKLRHAIPQARIDRRFQVVLDGLTVTLPATRLPQLVRLGFVSKVYPSVRYRMRTDRSPSVIGADELHALTGARGEGVKIGVVDDGVDETNPFLRPDGFSYPAGFPKGGRKWTTPKVIVARAFPGPNSGRPGRLALDRHASFHGTHVSGIAAGDAGTCSPGGNDHPPTCGLSGVAPRAYIGNYRVFNIPTPVGHVADTPEIVAAFESAVRDGMDVINFSGGGPDADPANDPMYETIRNVVNAGVVPVIAAGNDRDDFGLGTVGSPGTVPQAITVAAVSNTHVFSPALSVQAADAPDDLRQVPIASNGGANFPDNAAIVPHTVADVSTLTASGGTAVDRRLCGPEEDPNNEQLTPLAAGSLRGAIALVSRGHCTFISKAFRAFRAGAVGIILVDNRPGEANPIPLQLPIPAGMISDLDGQRLRAYMAAHGGAASVLIGHTPERIETGRSGIVTSFSSAGPTDFGHALKPDISAPGGQVLSSTLPEFTRGSPFAVFDGTSMATPHIAGSAALLVQLHRSWTPQEIKSALMSTAGPAWGNTARTQEAPVVLEGAGLASLPAANDPQIFTDPASLSYRELDVDTGARDRALLVRVSDAGDGAGVWQVELAPQSASTGATIDLPPAVTVPPGGEGELVAIARAGAAAQQGDDYGFILLRRGAVTRRIPYDFQVRRPGVELQLNDARKLRKFQAGDTLNGPNRAQVYCCPSEPFGPPRDYFGAPMKEDGAEKLYKTSVNRPVANLGVAVIGSSPGAIIDPWFLGSPDENDVQGYAGTPVNQNDLMFDYKADIGAAGAVFPREQQFYVSVDSGSDNFTGRSAPGRYILRSWQNDVRPPTIRLLTTRVAAGRPTIFARITDKGAGVDPLSLAIGYRKVLVGAALYDPFSGIAAFPLPTQARTIPRGLTRATLVASDFQEAKNIETIGPDILPNTAFKSVRIRGVGGPALSWIVPGAGACVPGNARLIVAASSTKKVLAVRFLVDGRQVDLDKHGTADLFVGSWHASAAKIGPHLLSAVARDQGGHTLTANRNVRVCR